MTMFIGLIVDNDSKRITSVTASESDEVVMWAIERKFPNPSKYEWIYEDDETLYQPVPEENYGHFSIGMMHMVEDGEMIDFD